MQCKGLNITLFRNIHKRKINEFLSFICILFLSDNNLSKLSPFNSRNMSKIVIIIFVCNWSSLLVRQQTAKESPQAKSLNSHLQKMIRLSKRSNILLDGQFRECENQSNKFQPFNFTEPNLIWCLKMDSPSDWVEFARTSICIEYEYDVSGRQSSSFRLIPISMTKVPSAAEKQQPPQ